MRTQLTKLAVRHGVARKPCIIPLSDPVDYPVTVEGLASTADIDLDRMRFRSYAFCNPFFQLKGYELPPLLYKHDEAQVAGEIEDLSYDDRGNLRIRVRVTHELAKRSGAFSIRCKIVAYELRDVETKNFHALVSNAELVEVSLTDTPANPNARVQHRYRAAPVTELLAALGKTDALLIRRVEIVQQSLKLLQQISIEHRCRSQDSAPPAERPPAPRVSRPIAPAVRRPTEFSRLVQEMNRK